MAYFPFFIDIKNADGLIIGSGKHAQEKIEKLAPYGAKLRVVEEFQESGSIANFSTGDPEIQLNHGSDSLISYIVPKS